MITYNYGLTSGIMSQEVWDTEHGTIVEYALRAFNIQCANVAAGGITKSGNQLCLLLISYKQSKF